MPSKRTPKPKLFQNYIGGEWMDAYSEDTFENRNPATGELIGEFAQSDARDVDAAVQAAGDCSNSALARMRVARTRSSG